MIIVCLFDCLFVLKRTATITQMTKNHTLGCVEKIPFSKRKSSWTVVYNI